MTGDPARRAQRRQVPPETYRAGFGDARPRGALNSVEPPVRQLAELDLFHAGEAWASTRRPMVVEAVQKRLGALEAWLDGRDYLEDRFTAGDLLMTTVLRKLRHTDIVSGRPALKAYQERCEGRPAFRKAMADHLKPFESGAVRTGT
jgi:glutathione S-transferase